MANQKSSGAGDELSPEQQKFQETKEQQRQQDAAAGQTFQSDSGEYLKSGRQQKEEKKAAKKAAKPESEAVSRREFLNYAWGAALGVVLVEAGIAGFLFTVPRFKEGEFGGLFNLGTFSSLPPVDGPPISNLDGKFWTSNDADGFRALYRVCTHLGCLYEWKDQTFRFECPCHGSKFQKTGKYIEGPAPRSLDQFYAVLEENGQKVADITEGGEPLPAAQYPNAEVIVDTGQILKGQPH
ncbi:MAG: Rieske 2Fe-2S domain-containing protein [Caldilineae bacterium]|nr:Rieske 2Fe-2S domain-containing protein [Anaerolineae bacterium]MCB0206450.1 Rieske 2Fe-2S domain-containing protein [Anaerolineae bacterium]MCB0255293.1 Rieske 2Fe-2S domain-containing protein [Anaerolineae bacterium]MCB9154151.1 Rieske 2Fe-2S domain-containing protein [Caldilineae bacterium]